MVWIWFAFFGIVGLLLINHFGLPEEPLPMPAAPEQTSLIENAQPYRYEGSSGVAFLICHGYGGSPFNTRPLGKYLHSLGHTAIGVLLPGHGTDIKDMQQTRFYHWEEYLERRYLKERSRYRQIFLVGFSMGGTVSLRVAAKNADSFRPAGLITISSPVFFNGFYNGKLIIHQYTLMFTGLLKIFKPLLTVGGKRPVSTEKLNPWVGYRYTYALDALHSFKRAMPLVRKGLPRVTVPYCSIMAANDRTVSAENQAYIYNNVNSREKRALMFILPPDMTSMHSLLTHKRVNQRVFRYIHSFIEDTLHDQRRAPQFQQKRGFWSQLRGWLGVGSRRGERDLLQARPRLGRRSPDAKS
ncbi:MAG: alpha/beta fold hydrolase [Leptospiraceae bacterium]|nr:alpha/beta fold hydrolase [Leptospiraceae bacterium]